MARLKKHRRSTLGLTVGVIATLAGVIGLIIIVTLGFKGQLDLSFKGIEKGSDKESYRNVTLTDAQIECEQKARVEIGDQLRLITLDQHSSRFEEKPNRYKLFFSVDVYPEGESTHGNSDPFLLNCFVHGSHGLVTNFELLKVIEHKAKPHRQSGENVFGF